MTRVPQRPFPGPSLRELQIDDYDDGDPYSCMAAGAAEQNHNKAVKARLDDLLFRVESCFGEPEAALQQLIEEDVDNVKAVLYDIWYNGRFIFNGKKAQADWAAQQSARLGNAALVEYDRNA